MIPNVRQFKLRNGNGVDYDMTRPEALLHSPNGLGWGTEATITRLGMTYTAIDEREKHQTPSGEMIFRDYREYANFLAFLQVGGLYLFYKPLDTWYRARCLASIDKSEIRVENDHLICPITFTLTTYWYEWIQKQTSSAVMTENAKEYDYTYDYQYQINASNSFDFDLALPSYFRITIFGECINPVWTLTVNGVTQKTGKLTTTISAGNKAVISTDPRDMMMWQYNASTGASVGNLYGYSDFSTARIFPLPRGKSTLTITSDDLTTPQVSVEVFAHV